MIATWVTYGAAFVFATLLVQKIMQIEKHTKAIKNQIARQSLTFVKIETDIDALHKALIEFARDDECLKKTVVKLRDRRANHFRSIIEDGFYVPEILRGLDEPHIDDDPNYWTHRTKLFENDLKE